ncbi:MAG TPA: metal-dependent phosphohydrolase, partial [Clostridium sp.]|nr:metal-dependent phosphohydrolase [Clostridium sp.]
MEELKYKVPNRKIAEKILEEASILNPGPWVEHSR